MNLAERMNNAISVCQTEEEEEEILPEFFNNVIHREVDRKDKWLLLVFIDRSANFIVNFSANTGQIAATIDDILEVIDFRNLGEMIYSQLESSEGD